MRIAMLSASVSRSAGGLFESVRGAATALAALPGVVARAIGPADEHTDEDAQAWAPVPLSLYRVRGPRSWGYSPDLGPLLRRERPDLLHGHGLWMYPSIAALGLGRSAGTPRVISPRGMLEAWALRRHPWRKRAAYALFEGRNLATAAALHALTGAEADSLRALGLSRPIAVIPNGVAIDERPPACAAPWPDGGPVMLFLGRLHPKKGLPALIDAWIRARATLAPEGWRLAIVGWDQDGHRAELERLAGRAGGSILILGPAQGELKRACFAGASAFVLPSLSEGMPMAVLEAWANSLPTIITPGCNLPEGAAAGAAIETLPDAASLATALAAFAELKQSERCRMGQAGRDLVVSRYSWPTIAQRMADLYRWILGGGAPPADVRHV